MVQEEPLDARADQDLENTHGDDPDAEGAAVDLFSFRDFVVGVTPACCGYCSWCRCSALDVPLLLVNQTRDDVIFGEVAGCDGGRVVFALVAAVVSIFGGGVELVTAVAALVLFRFPMGKEREEPREHHRGIHDDHRIVSVMKLDNQFDESE